MLKVNSKIEILKVKRNILGVSKKDIDIKKKTINNALAD